MVKPSDYAMHHGPFPPTYWQPMSSGQSMSSARPRTAAGVSWVLKLPPSHMHESPRFQLSFRRRPETSGVYHQDETFRPGSPPKSLRTNSTEEPLARWVPATKWPTYNVCSPSQRSLSTIYGTAATDQEGMGWNSRPSLSLTSSRIGSIGWETTSLPHSRLASPTSSFMSDTMVGTSMSIHPQERVPNPRKRTPFAQARQ